MSLHDVSYADAVRNAEHYLAIGKTKIYLYGEDGPWNNVTDISAGGSYRLNGPASVRLEAPDPCGLTFTWSVDFEASDANGRGTNLFDRDKLRDLARRLPAPARRAFAEFLRNEVLPGVRKTTGEIRAALNKQQDSEDCLLGLIDFAGEK